jgi:arylsulfatase A-like enzyme
MVDLAGGAPAKGGPLGAPPLAGMGLAAALLKERAAPHDFLYFNHNNNRAIRVGDSKLIATGEAGPWELYDLSKDRCELQNLAAAQPDRAQQLAALWQNHEEAFVRAREAAPPIARPRMRPAGAK